MMQDVLMTPSTFFCQSKPLFSDRLAQQKSPTKFHRAAFRVIKTIPKNLLSLERRECITNLSDLGKVCSVLAVSGAPVKTSLAHSEHRQIIAWCYNWICKIWHSASIYGKFQ